MNSQPHAIRIDLTDVTFLDCAKTDKYFAPLYLQATDLVDRPAGNLHCRRVTVKDELIALDLAE